MHHTHQDGGHSMASMHYRHLGIMVVLSFIAVSAVALVLFFALIRYQTMVGDQQSLRSMIPHHAGAILMCKEATLADPEIKQLCSSIVTGQENEIAQMKAILERK